MLVIWGPNSRPRTVSVRLVPALFLTPATNATARLRLRLLPPCTLYVFPARRFTSTCGFNDEQRTPRTVNKFQLPDRLQKDGPVHQVQRRRLEWTVLRVHRRRHLLARTRASSHSLITRRSICSSTAHGVPHEPHRTRTRTRNARDAAHPRCRAGRTLDQGCGINVRVLGELAGVRESPYLRSLRLNEPGPLCVDRALPKCLSWRSQAAGILSHNARFWRTNV